VVEKGLGCLLGKVRMTRDSSEGIAALRHVPRMHDVDSRRPSPSLLERPRESTLRRFGTVDTHDDALCDLSCVFPMTRYDSDRPGRMMENRATHRPEEHLVAHGPADQSTQATSSSATDDEKVSLGGRTEERPGGKITDRSKADQRRCLTANGVGDSCC
jgi:hypothetical protein